MDTDELARIEETLLLAIAKAKAISAYGVPRRFHEVVRHAREMHDILLEALCRGRALVSQRLWGLSIALGNAVDELERRDTWDERRLV